MGGYVLDFYCHKIKLAIEVDGEVHSDATQNEYDHERTTELRKRGIEVIRFTNDEVLNLPAEVLNAIQKISSERKKMAL
jgi:very-short-patch-repair endonuclease